MGPGGHAVNSPSSAERWLNCTPSARINAMSPRGDTLASLEGSAAHALAEYKVRTFLGEEGLQRPTSDFDCDDMETYTDDYLIFIREKIAKSKEVCADPFIAVELGLDLTEYIPYGYGTCDCCIVADKTMYIVDLKYGKGVVVDAFENSQLKIYALGCLSQFSFLYQVESVELNIFQPRRENVSSWTVSAADLLRWGEEVLKPKAAESYLGGGNFLPGEWCRFCSIADTCKARAQEMLALTRFEFREPYTLSDEELGEVLSKAERLKSWVEDVKTYCEEQAINEGRIIPGYKLVEGRSVRQFTDIDKAAKAALAAGVKEDDLYTRSMLSLTALEKLMGKRAFGEAMEGLITKSTPKLALVSANDKRPAVQLATAKDDFLKEKKL